MSSANRAYVHYYDPDPRLQDVDSPRPSDPDSEFNNNWRQQDYDDFNDNLPTLPPLGRLTRDSYSYPNTGESGFERQTSAAPSSPLPVTYNIEDDDDNEFGFAPFAGDEWPNLHGRDLQDFERDLENDFAAGDHYHHYMPTHRQSPSFVDLTREATPPLSQERSTLSRFSDSGDLSEPNMPPAAKRSRPPAASTSSSPTTPETLSGPAYKRPRLNSTSRQEQRGSDSQSALTTNNHNTPDVSEIEHIDLAEAEDSKSLAEALQKQRVEQVKAQAEPAADAPLRLSNLTCVICMDTPKDITATACGHVFCHTCLMEALIAGENRTGYEGPKRSQCPVCRKTLNRTKASDVIPLLLKKGLATQPRRQRQS